MDIVLTVGMKECARSKARKAGKTLVSQNKEDGEGCWNVKTMEVGK